MRVLVIDNYDSFTYNLVQLLGRFTKDIIVKRNDEISKSDIEDIAPQKILLSPGPGKPEDSKMTLTAIREFGETISILGVCLGHQAIGISFGATVIHAPLLMHGKTSQVFHDGKSIFAGVEDGFTATRYHSLIIDEKTIPDELEITAKTEDGIIMGVRHRRFPIEGIQFHPESFLTVRGEKLIENWVNK